jgi:hypothetical protein
MAFLLLPYIRVFLQKLIVAELAKFPFFYHNYKVKFHVYKSLFSVHILNYSNLVLKATVRFFKMNFNISFLTIAESS